MNLSKRTETLEEAARDYEETCQAIAEGLADMEAGRTIPFEEVRAQCEAEKPRRKTKHEKI